MTYFSLLFIIHVLGGLIPEVPLYFQIITLVEKMEKLRDISVHANVQSCLDKWLEGIRKVQARRKEEIVNAANRHRAGVPRQQEDKGQLTLII